MIINLIRHGKTKGNAEKRYIGVTDEPLSREGMSELTETAYPQCDILVVSPMKRCIMTADIIYPHMEKRICSDFTEIDFGRFEGKNYLELSGDEDYQKWIDSGGILPFPEGEDASDFRQRCVSGFMKLYEELPRESVISMIIHGGTIMSLLERFSDPPSGYYDNQCPNGHGYTVDFDGISMRRIAEI